MSQNNVALIAPEAAQAFLEAARRPDPETLRRRDAFLARIRTECVYRREGSDLVMELPDLDSQTSAVRPDASALIAYVPARRS